MHQIEDLKFNKKILHLKVFKYFFLLAIKIDKHKNSLQIEIMKFSSFLQGFLKFFDPDFDPVNLKKNLYSPNWQLLFNNYCLNNIVLVFLYPVLDPVNSVI